jgi:DNA polymerase-3 subunit delta
MVCGEDDHAVTSRARAVYDAWSAELGGMDHEVVAAAASNASEALSALNRLREALQTLPFFGGAKAVWFQNCTFLGDDRTADARDVGDALAELSADLKKFQWTGVRLLISAGKVDKRKTFYKTIEKIGAVESHGSWGDKDWEAQAQLAAAGRIRGHGKQITDDALATLVTFVGPHPAALASEVEKLVTYAGDRAVITAEDVEQIVSRGKTARAFALGDALGERDLPKALAMLDNELWEMPYDKDKSYIGLLFGLISKVRAMLFTKELARAGLIRESLGDRDYNTFKSQLDGVPRPAEGAGRKSGPLSANPYVLFRAFIQSRRYTTRELVWAMELLLQANLQLVSSAADKPLVLQRLLVQIIQRRPQ